MCECGQGHPGLSIPGPPSASQWPHHTPGLTEHPGCLALPAFKDIPQSTRLWTTVLSSSNAQTELPFIPVLAFPKRGAILREMVMELFTAGHPRKFSPFHSPGRPFSFLDTNSIQLPLKNRPACHILFASWSECHWVSQNLWLQLVDWLREKWGPKRSESLLWPHPDLHPQRKHGFFLPLSSFPLISSHNYLKPPSVLSLEIEVTYSTIFLIFTPSCR